MQKKRIYLSPPDVSSRERELLLEAFDSNWIAPLGPMVDRFECEIAAYAKMPYAVALSSGTAGLHLLLQEVGVSAGDSVFVSTFTFAATANAVRYCGAEPIWIDSEESSWNMDPECLERALADAAEDGQLPKAVVVVDLYGQSADYDRIIPIADRYCIPIIEDSAEALGASYKGRPCGSFGRAGVFSFNGNKIITTSGGGMIVTPDQALAERLRYLATQARQPAPHYEHTEVGYNYRLSNLLAAVGIGQLESLPEKIARRRNLRKRYADLFARYDGICMMPIPEWSAPNYWLSCIEVDPKQSPVSAEDLRLALEADNIEARPLWKPMHQQPVFKDYRAYLNGVSDRLFKNGLCLPSGSNMSEADWDRIAKSLEGALTR
jgi:dTDP-4-amino-4,6-dideoxygalactose transaminase